MPRSSDRSTGVGTCFSRDPFEAQTAGDGSFEDPGRPASSPLCQSTWHGSCPSPGKTTDTGIVSQPTPGTQLSQGGMAIPAWNIVFFNTFIYLIINGYSPKVLRKKKKKKGKRRSLLTPHRPN